MASMLSSQGVVLAISGTVILLAFRLRKTLILDQISQPSQHVLRPCLSSDGKKEKKIKKKVHFAEDVMDARRDGEEFRKDIMKNHVKINNSAGFNSSPKFKKSVGGKDRGIPANRLALYNGILRDRAGPRFAYSC